MLLFTAGDANGWTPLHRAAYHRHEEGVRFLLEKGHDVDLKYSFRRTVLYLVAIKGHDTIAALLIQNSAAITDRDNRKATALHFTAYSRSTYLFQVLLRNNADMTAKDDRRWSTINVAASARNEPVVWLLLKTMIIYKTETSTSSASLFPNDLEVVQMLLENGADCSKHSIGEWTAGNGYGSVMQLLFKKGN